MGSDLRIINIWKQEVYCSPQWGGEVLGCYFQTIVFEHMGVSQPMGEKGMELQAS
jgi:hypothetical protein